MSKEISKYNKNGKCIYNKSEGGIETWHNYDENNNLIYSKGSNNLQEWNKYDSNGRLVYSKSIYNNNLQYEFWRKYDKNNKRIQITKQEFKQIERNKMYLNNKKINRFEIMDI